MSAPTSRWFTMQCLCGWMYSIGSSTVRIWRRFSRLILSMIAASVVDLPEPVAPVTRIKPRGFSANDATTGGSPSFLERQDLERDQSKDPGDRAALHEDVAAKAREPP